MKGRAVLIVDDEKNIRMTLSMTLEAMGLQTKTAVNGEEALRKLSECEFWLMLLDLRLPGMNGLEVLQYVRKEYPGIRIIIITAHGTVESAVEAMKIGAVDFMQKPFTTTEVREMVNQVAQRETLDESKVEDYRSLIEICKRHITHGNIDLARETAQRAISRDPAKPEAYNLFAAFLELQGDRIQAQKFYRAALDIDGSYKPARANLQRITSIIKSGEIEFWPDLNQAEEEGR